MHVSGACIINNESLFYVITVCSKKTWRLFYSSFGNERCAIVNFVAQVQVKYSAIQKTVDKVSVGMDPVAWSRWADILIKQPPLRS